MGKRSTSYPSKPLTEAEKFAISVFQKVGETQLKYADLAKQGNVALREADSYAVSAGQYGWMVKHHGQGYSAVGKICTALRAPHDDKEKNEMYLKAFQSPALYKTLITEWNGKKTTEEAIKISLIRSEAYQFLDAGAKIAAKIFIENAKFLGLINEDDMFNIDAEIIIDPSVIKEKPIKQKPSSPTHVNKKGATEKEKIKPKKEEPLQSQQSPSSGSTKKIPIFVRGQELHFPVLENMTQSDWDAIIKQLQNIKSFSK